MLTQDYSSPASQDWSSYLGGNKGLLFQPWTSDYQTAAGIPNNLWNYAPPEGIDYAVRYTNPLTGKLDMDLMPAGDSKTGAKKGADGNWTSSEGFDYDEYGYEINPRTGLRTGNKINDSLGIGSTILGWMGADSAGVQRANRYAEEHGIDVDVGGGVAPEIEIGKAS